jgi:macrolide-specific efflux system membrane fusion protein
MNEIKKETHTLLNSSRSPSGNKNKKIKWFTLPILCILIGIFIFQRSQRELKTTYREIVTEKGAITVSILATGTVQPENRLEIKPPIAGRIEEVLVAEGQKVKKGQILAWMSSSERAALLDSARAKGQDEVTRWEDLYRPTPIVAPIDGTIILRSIEAGQTFASTDAVLVMSDRLTVKAQVDETDISQIKLKQSAQVILDAYSDQKISAHVQQIAYEAKTVNNVTTYQVDVLPHITPQFMRAGMTANVTFILQKKEDIITVPNEAIKSSKNNTTVTIKMPDGKSIEKKIQLGISDGKRTEVISGISDSETVLIPEMNSKTSKGNNTANPFNPMGRTPRGGR